MRRNLTVLIKSGAICASVLAACLFGAGCGKSPAPANDAGKTPAKKAATTGSAATPVKVAATATNAFLSVFSTENARDPFHPNIKPKNATPTVLAGPQTEADTPAVIAALQSGFQGIFGDANAREVMVHGVLLPENREKTVTVRVGGQLRALKLKAVKIYRTAAELQVEGLAQTVTVPKVR